VMVSDDESFAIADIPGLIEGAHLGHGLGIRFLKHLSRTRLLIYVLDVADKPADAFNTVRGEIEAFDPELLARPALIALNKIDLLATDDVLYEARELAAITHLEVLPTSADKRFGLAPLVARVAAMLHEAEQPSPCPT
jgi:GTPase